MKRRFGTVIAMVLCFILTVVSVYADDGKGQNPDYVTDYYMIVQSTQGGVDIYDEADTQSVKLNDSKIPNGTCLTFWVRRMEQTIKNGHMHSTME